ncbi:Protein-export membrane protein SecG [Serratia symbiotica]|nr:Protein-export membrane protein SecG [Serratia symbiotica]
MYEVLLVIFLLFSMSLVTLIILQQGKGAAASFGAGSSSTLFGPSGSGNFMTRITSLLAMLFFIMSLILSNLSSNKSNKNSNWENLANPATPNHSTAQTVASKMSSDIPQ